jgi:hypothetical protein
MIEISEIKQHDSLFFKLLDPELAIVVNELTNSEYHLTQKCICMLYNRICLIKNSIYAIIENDELYSASVLYRSFLEHFLRFQYCVYRLIIEKTDDVGIEYYKYLNASESFQYAHSVKISRSIFDEGFDPNEIEIELDRLIKTSSEYKDISKNNVRNISAKFEYKNIIKYLNSVHKTIDPNEIYPLRNLIVSYSELSSYTHGGPWAEDEIGGLLANIEKYSNQKSLMAISTLNIFVICSHHLYLLMHMFVNKKAEFDYMNMYQYML